MIPGIIPQNNPSAIIRGRRNRQRGNAGEVLAMRALECLAVRCAHLETGWRVRRIGGRIIGATPMRSVLADIVGVKLGRAVLCEVKVEDGRSLSLSRIEPHQRANLDTWKHAGAVVLIAWVKLEPCAWWSFPVALLPWPCPEMTHGHPITEAQAWGHHVNETMKLRAMK